MLKEIIISKYKRWDRVKVNFWTYWQVWSIDWDVETTKWYIKNGKINVSKSLKSKWPLYWVKLSDIKYIIVPEDNIELCND